MNHTIRSVVKQPAVLADRLGHYRESLDTKRDFITLSELGGGVTQFAEAVFPGAGLENIYAQRNVREPEGRGPHFDMYNENIHESYPWLGVYNMAGTCTVRAAIMPAVLAEEYARLYPSTTEEAYHARRHIGALVLGSRMTVVEGGSLQEGMGLILPQQKDGPSIIHEVVPENPREPGSFIKLVVPEEDSETRDILRGEDCNFKPLDELLTDALREPTIERDELDRVMPLQPRDDIHSSSDSISGQLLD